MTLQLSLRPEWSQFDVLRQEAARYFEQRHLAPDTAATLAMVVSELAENAAKYGVFRRAGDAITVRIAHRDGAVTIEVGNPLGPQEHDHLVRLDRMIQWIRGFQDPFQAYLQRVKELSEEGPGSTESGLGLARIAYEGQARLDFVLRDPSVVLVSAVHRLEPPRGGP